jgi:hypothetical protein
MWLNSKLLADKLCKQQQSQHLTVQVFLLLKGFLPAGIARKATPHSPVGNQIITCL